MNLQQPLWDTEVTLRQENVHPSKKRNPRWLVFTSSEPTVCVAFQHSSWLSESIAPGRTLFSHWPSWCVISNNLSECLIGRAAFIGPRHLCCLTLSSPMLQENCQMILNEGQLTPFSEGGWTERRDVIRAKLSAAEHEGRETTCGWKLGLYSWCRRFYLSISESNWVRISFQASLCGLSGSWSCVLCASASWTHLQQDLISYIKVIGVNYINSY